MFKQKIMEELCIEEAHRISTAQVQEMRPVQDGGRGREG